MSKVINIDSLHDERFDTEDEAFAFIKALTDITASISEYPDENDAEAFEYGLLIRARHRNIRDVTHYLDNGHVVRFYGDHEEDK